MNEGKVLDPSSVFETIEKLLGDARKSVLMVSPFITLQLFEKLLKKIDNDVEVTLITRFRPDEIAKRLNSLDLFGIMRERSRGELRLSYHLHAKYYRADNVAVLGSGNLTHNGLNTHPRGNHEIMILVDTGFSGISQFEKKISSRSTVPTEEEISDLREVVEGLASISLNRKLEIVPPLRSRIDDTPEWIPTCESPSSIFSVYLNELREIDPKIVQDAKVDLAYLSIPNGINENQFKKYVRIVIRQSSLMAAFKIELDKNRRLEKQTGINMIEKNLNMNPEEAEKLWFSAINWLTYFFPEKFQLNSI